LLCVLANATQEEAPKVKPVSLNGVSEKQKVTEWLQMANEEVTGKARPPTAPPQGTTSPKRTAIDYVHDVTQDGDVEANPGMAEMRPSAWVVLVQGEDEDRTVSRAVRVMQLDGVPWDVDGLLKSATRVNLARKLDGVAEPDMFVKRRNHYDAPTLSPDEAVPHTTVGNPLYIFAPAPPLRAEAAPLRAEAAGLPKFFGPSGAFSLLSRSWSQLLRGYGGTPEQCSSSSPLEQDSSTASQQWLPTSGLPVARRRHVWASPES